MSAKVIFAKRSSNHLRKLVKNPALSATRGTVREGHYVLSLGSEWPMFMLLKPSIAYFFIPLVLIGDVLEFFYLFSK